MQDRVIRHFFYAVTKITAIGVEFCWDFLLIFQVEQFQEAFPGHEVKLHECHFIRFLDEIGCIKLQLELPTHQDRGYDLLR